jgi:nanoRNase/pAp phosphatase (c-di-AMP/oligoRNAs hydrolase)
MEALSQAKNIIEGADSILILSSPDSQGDSAGAAIALFFTLKKLGKKVNMPKDPLPERLGFLSDVKESGDFVISVNSPISKMRYEKDGEELKIYLTSKSNMISPSDIRLIPQSQEVIFPKEPPSPGLIITIGAESLESLGDKFAENSLLFSKAAILNIDNQALNENFGDINLVDLSASLSEIVFSLIKLINDDLDQRTATALLTGIVWASQNFRNPRTRPKTFEAAASLIEKGADHQKIVYNLYKHNKVPQIKLLGRILEKIHLNEEKQMYSASLTEKDFEDCQATSKDLSFVVEELKFNFRYLPNLLVLWESHASPIIIKGILSSPDKEIISRILENFEGTSRGSSALFLVRENGLESAEEKILNII